MDYLVRLEKLMGRLRSKNGCPWDKRQTHRSLKPYLIEEAHETLDAIDSGDPRQLEEELGDLLLQVVFHARIAKEKGRFNLQDVAKGIGDKLVRRHPHVFGKSSRRVADINRKWEELKRQEKPERASVLDGLPRSLPALLRTQRMLEKMAKGAPVLTPREAQRRAERAWRAFLSPSRSRDRAAGEFLLAFARLAQAQGVHSEMSLRRAANRLERSFRKGEKAAIRTARRSPGVR